MTSSLSDDPVFVVGSPRSGTSVLCACLDAHPNIFAPYWETGLFVALDGILNDNLAKSLMQYGRGSALQRSDLVAWARESVERYFLTVRQAVDKRRWAEKTPAHVFHIQLISELFPRAKFIHILRNGRDVVRSLQQMPWTPRRINWSIDRWVRSVRAGREAAATLPPRHYVEVKYENFLDSPEAVLRNLCDFIDEEYSPMMLRFEDPAINSWGIPRAGLQSVPVNKHPPLQVLENLRFKWKARSLMRELGYK